MGGDLLVAEVKEDIGGSAVGIELQAYHQTVFVGTVGGAARLHVDGARDKLLELAAYVEGIVIPGEFIQDLRGRRNDLVFAGRSAPQTDATVAQNHVPVVLLVDDTHGEQELGLQAPRPRLHADHDGATAAASALHLTVQQFHTDLVVRRPGAVTIFPMD